MSIRPNSAVDATSPYNKLAVSVRMNSTVLSVLSIALALAISTAVMSAHAHVRLDAGWGGPFWHLPLMVWLAVAGLAILCLFIESALPRAACIFLFGFATMGVLGYLEPFGVFHDSWQNVGLGQLAVSEGQGGQIWNVPYVASSPGSFLLYGALRLIFPDTASFLRVYPTLCVLLYIPGMYVLATAFARRQLKERVRPERFGLGSSFAFIALASIFDLRVNPAPQSLAFALMPFFVACLLHARERRGGRVLALCLFVAILSIHPITAVTSCFLVLGWRVTEQLLGTRPEERTASSNTTLLYSCLFLAWLVYAGVWVIRTGDGFAKRLLSVANSGQTATATAGPNIRLQSFVWVHRFAFITVALLVVVGLVLVFRDSRVSGARLLTWFLVAAAWLPGIVLGEFGDRAPLFASLPAALCVGRVLCLTYRRWLVLAAVLAAAMASYVTAYSNQVGEVITRGEVQAFAQIIPEAGNRKIVYGYSPPLIGSDARVYAQNRIRAYALGAADFRYNRLLAQRGVIVISDQMRMAAKLRGRHAAAQLHAFELHLRQDPTYSLIYHRDGVRAYRAR